MNRTVKQIWRYGKWLLFLGMLVVALWLWFVPFAKWVFVGKTLDVYNEVAKEYSEDDDAVRYEGVITDTLMRPSVRVKGKQDTVVHRQTIQLAPQIKPSDGKPRMEDVGVFGDSAGLLNAFFSFLAFMAVLLTIYLQSRKDGHDKQNGARVLFEQEFFAMVGMLENIVAHLKFTDNKPVEDKKMINDIVAHYYQRMGIGLGQDEEEDKLPAPKVVEGREVFKYIYADREHYNLLQYVSKEKDLRQSAQAQEMCFDGTLDHYFRYLYRILKHIDKSELLGKLDEPEKEREYYAHLLRAQLSNYELLMLFYNGLLGENPQTIKTLIEKYAMFNNLRAWELGIHQQKYYHAIQDECWYEDPADYDAETTYSVTAFWDGEKRKKFKAQAQKEKRKGNNAFSWIKGWQWRKKSEKPAEVVVSAEPVVLVETAKKAERPEQPAKPVKQKKEKNKAAGKAEKPKNLEEKRRGRKKR